MSRYQIAPSNRAARQLKKLREKRIEGRIIDLLEAIAKNPREGIGRPKNLIGMDVETWSRRIDSKNRIVYEIYEKEKLVILLSITGHYKDR